MTYSYKYKNNPAFPYINVSKKKGATNHSKETCPKKETLSNEESSLFDSLFSPIESILGRKIQTDDLILVAIIYVIFTEKNSDNNLLLLCLFFILLS